MAHEIEEFVSVRSVPWHGLGTVVPDVLTAKEALVLAGLDWEVELRPLFCKVDQEVRLIAPEGGGEPELVRTDLDTPAELEVDGSFAVVRDSDLSVLGVVGGRYVPVQNHRAFDFFDGLVGSKEAKYETAGSLDGGRRVFMTARVPRDIKIGGADAVDLYLVLATSHDGSLALTAMVTPVRVVCQNTLNMALNGAKQRWTMKHTDSIDGKIAVARNALDLTFGYVDEFEKEAEQLLALDFSKAQFEAMVRDVFPGKKEASVAFTPEQYGMIGLLESSPTLDDGLRYTGWGALNAVAEWDDWGRTFRSSESRSEAEQRTQAAWFGASVTRKTAVQKYLVGLAAGV